MNVDIKDALNAAFSFRTTPESLEANNLLAKEKEVPSDIDFALEPVLFRGALNQHQKVEVEALMQELAKANAAAKAFIQNRVEKFMKQMDQETAASKQKAVTSSNATKVNATTKIETQPAKEETSKRAPMDKMSLQEAVLHGQLTARELEGVLRDLHRDVILTPADEQQIKDEARALWEAGTAAVLNVDQSLPKHFTTMVIDAFPWANLLMADDVTKLVLDSPLAKAAARIRAKEVLDRQERYKKELSWISRMVVPTIATAKVKKGQAPHVYDAALDAVIHNEFDKLLGSATGEKLTEDTFRRVVSKLEDAPENIARTIASTLHSTFVNHYINRTSAAGIDYWAPRSFAKRLLSQMKPLNPYLAQRKRDLDAAASRASSSSSSSSRTSSA